MKVTAFLFGAVLAVVSVNATAIPEADPNRFAPTHHLCWEIGSPCSKLKRAADAVSLAISAREASAEADNSHFCYRSDQPCSKARRDALALAEAIADAYAIAMPDPEPKREYPHP